MSYRQSQKKKYDYNTEYNVREKFTKTDFNVAYINYIRNKELIVENISNSIFWIVCPFTYDGTEYEAWMFYSLDSNEYFIYYWGTSGVYFVGVLPTNREYLKREAIDYSEVVLREPYELVNAGVFLAAEMQDANDAVLAIFKNFLEINGYTVVDLTEFQEGFYFNTIFTFLKRQVKRLTRLFEGQSISAVGQLPILDSSFNLESDIHEQEIDYGLVPGFQEEQSLNEYYHEQNKIMKWKNWKEIQKLTYWSGTFPLSPSHYMAYYEGHGFYIPSRLQINEYYTLKLENFIKGYLVLQGVIGVLKNYWALIPKQQNVAFGKQMDYPSVFLDLRIPYRYDAEAPLQWNANSNARRFHGNVEFRENSPIGILIDLTMGKGNFDLGDYQGVWIESVGREVYFYPHNLYEQINLGRFMIDETYRIARRREFIDDAKLAFAFAMILGKYNVPATREELPPEWIFYR